MRLNVLLVIPADGRPSVTPPLCACYPMLLCMTTSICCLSLPISSSSSFNSTNLTGVHMVCRNLCERLGTEISVGSSCYRTGGRYCRRCEVYFYCNDFFCPCCGMRLRLSPTTKKGKERLRRLRLGELFRQTLEEAETAAEEEPYKLTQTRVRTRA
jgi:hypothetical protein